MKTGDFGDTANIIINKTIENALAGKIKQFEEYRQHLEKLKIEFQDNFKRKAESVCGLTDFEITTTLGHGAFGSVVLAKHRTSNKYYAMKILNKGQLVKEKQTLHTLNERNVLGAIRYPFCIHMEFGFKDNCNIYFVLPFIVGGDMFSLLRRSKTFKEKDAKFYAAQIILALEYLHFMGLIYRDLKPENIVIHVNGYIKLADFGFAKMLKLRTYTLCGTAEYLAPEIILNKGYGKAVDWWAIGIFIYEMIAGFTPFYCTEPMDMFEKIVAGKFKYTEHFSVEARDLVRNILQVDLSKRYGNLKNGVIDIKIHDWFKLTDWQAIYNRKAVAPFIPKMESPYDTSNFDKFGDIRIQESINEKFPKEFEEF